MKKACLLILAYAFAVIRSVTVLAQQGAWLPADADTTYPRTLLNTTETATVRASLSEPVRWQLYKSVYQSANANAPTGNTATADRRNRARLAKNAAFILYIGLKPATTGNLDTLLPQQKQALVSKIKTLLQATNTAVENVSQYTEWQWRSKELIDYLIAYDLLRGAGLPADSLVAEQAKLQLFTANLYAAATQSFGGVGSFFDNVKNNHSLMTASALGMAAVVLNQASGSNANQQAQKWIETGLYHIDNVLWRDARRLSDPNKIAEYAEGPYYFKYAFLNCLPFFRALGHFLPDRAIATQWGSTTRNVRNPYYAPVYDLLYTWAAAITMPDGRLPALEDSFIDQAMPELVLSGKPRFVKPIHLQNLEPVQLNTLQEQLDVTVDMRAAYLAVPLIPTPPADTLVALPDAGNLIFRSGTDSASAYFQLYGKNGPSLVNSGGHNQADAASFMLYSKGQLLALDPGYLSYERRTEIGNATNHNMLLVDGAGPAIGTAGEANDAQAFILNTFDAGTLAYGEVHTSYKGTEIIRKALSVRHGAYFILADQLSANDSHEFTWQLHGYGLQNGTTQTGVFTPDYANKHATWQKNGIRLDAIVTATGNTATYTDTLAIHELTYNTTQNHSVLRVKANGNQLNFVSVLQADTALFRQGQSLTQPGVAGILLTDSAHVETIAAQPDTTILNLQAPAPAIITDGQFVFVSQNNAAFVQQYFMQQGRLLVLGSDTLASSSQRVNFAWAYTDTTSGNGYVSAATTLYVHLPFYPVAVSGPGILSWQYNAETHILQISAAGATAFNVLFGSAPAGLLTAQTQNLQVYPNPVSGSFTITFPATVSDDDVKVSWQDITGRTLQQLTIPAQKNSTQLHLQVPSHLPKGMLLLHIQSGKRAWVNKVISL